MKTCSGGVWDFLRDDEIVSEFLGDDYDVTETTSRVTLGLNVSDHLRKLNDAVAIIDAEIHSQVSAHHGDLLSHATGIETLEEVLQMLHSRISSLLSAMTRVKTRTTDAYVRISGQTRQLARMQLACDLMRKTSRVLHLRRKLAGQVSAFGAADQTGQNLDPRADLAGAASNLFELKALLDGEDLAGVRIVEEDRSALKRGWKEVERRAAAILDSGVSTPNQSQISSALQVYANLDIVDSVIDKVVADAVERLDKVAAEGLDVHNLVNASSTSVAGRPAASAPPGRAVMPVPGNLTAFRATLWTNLEKFTNGVFVEYQKVAQLQIVVDKQFRLEQIDDNAVTALPQRNLLDAFWSGTIDATRQRFANVAESSHVTRAFESEFPKLLRFFNELWARVKRAETAATAAASGIRRCGAKDYEAKMRKAALAGFEESYLTRALSRLLDPINLMFATRSAESGFPETPSTEEMENVVKTLQQEVVVAAFDHTLVHEVCDIVSKAIRNFAAKCEMIIVDNDDAKQVIGPANATQLSNAAVVNSLYFFSESVGKVLASPAGASLPATAMQTLTEARETLTSLTLSVVSPLLSNVDEMLEKILATMHNEDFSSEDRDRVAPRRNASSPSSLYMRELNDFVARVAADYLAIFRCGDLLHEGELKRIASRTLRLFVLHAAMVRPVGSGGRLRLATDFAALEGAVSPLVAEPNRGGLASLGQAYKVLRGSRPLLFAEDDQIRETVKNGVVDPDLVALFLFGRGPPELRSPHQTMGWTECRYSKWLDDHPRLGDRLEMIRGALESYQQICKKKKVKEYTPVYPLILEVLNSASVED